MNVHPGDVPGRSFAMGQGSGLLVQACLFRLACSGLLVQACFWKTRLGRGSMMKLPTLPTSTKRLEEVLAACMASRRRLLRAEGPVSMAA
jgi:hypothetical protein